MGSVLFSAHMVQHELLMLVAAPLLVLGQPTGVVDLGTAAVLAPEHRAVLSPSRLAVPWLVVTGPLMAWLLHALALWLWHIPALFEAALSYGWRRTAGQHALPLHRAAFGGRWRGRASRPSPESVDDGDGGSSARRGVGGRRQAHDSSTTTASN